MTALKSAHLLFGGCGDARGMHEAGYEVVGGVNHARPCLDTARANWPDATWFQDDATNFPMELIPDAQVHFTGVVCTELTKQAGNRTNPPDEQDRIPTGADAIEADRYRLTYATAACVERDVEVNRPLIVFVENVADFVLRWRPYRNWSDRICAFDYRRVVFSLNAAHISGPDNPPADSSRDRTFTGFIHKDLPAIDFEPRPLAWCDRCEQDVESDQAWDSPVHAGEYRKHYAYVCAKPGCGRIVEPYGGSAARVFDFDDIGERIGGPRIKGNTLAAATIVRCEDGLRYLQDPQLRRRHSHPRQDEGGPINGRYHAVVELRNNCAGASIYEPLSTICRTRHHFLLSSPEGWRPGMRLDVRDAHLRTIYPREQVRAMRFPDHHVMAASTGTQLNALAGNAIPPNLAHFLGARSRAVLT